MNIINDILDFSKIEAGKINLEKTDFDLLEVVKQSVGLFEQRARDQHLVFGYSFSEDVPTRLIGDPMRLGQVLLNLLGNAIKFTEKGGVQLEISQELASGKKTVLRFAVHDTGIGISEAARKTLFQSFNQGDTSTTRKYGGTGLGLAICRRLVELMGGSIAVKSTPGEGSTFWFTLPFTKSESPDSVQSPAPTDTFHGEMTVANEGSPRILLVEDNTINQFVGVKQLTKLGYAVDVANNGVEAVDRWRQNKPKVVLMDCQMPVMDGYEASRRIRAIEAENQWPRTPIIAMTASIMADDRDRCLVAGMDGFITKPVNNAELKTALEKAMAATNPTMAAAPTVTPSLPA